MKRDSIIIAGTGLKVGIGIDAVSSCAAFRAGLNHQQDLGYCSFFVEDEDDELSGDVAIKGHVASDEALGAEGIGKMLALGHYALRDLLNTTPHSLLDQSNRLGIFVAVPDYSKRKHSLSQLEVESPNSSQADLYEFDQYDSSAAKASDFVKLSEAYLIDQLFALTEFPNQPVLSKIVYGDQISFCKVLDMAITALETNQLDACIVGGIDSFIEPATLEWGIESNKFRMEGNSSGFFPGEGASFILLHKQSQSRKQQTQVRGIIGRPEFAVEQQSLNNTAATRGTAITSTISKALAKFPIVDSCILITNLNGSLEYAKELGSCLVNLKSHHAEISDSTIWHPAASFGETGCVFPGIAISIAMHAKSRNYVKNSPFLIAVLSETLERSAFLVS